MDFLRSLRSVERSWSQIEEVLPDVKHVIPEPVWKENRSWQGVGVYSHLWMMAGLLEVIGRGGSRSKGKPM